MSNFELIKEALEGDQHAVRVIVYEQQEGERRVHDIFHCENESIADELIAKNYGLERPQMGKVVSFDPSKLK